MSLFVHARSHPDELVELLVDLLAEPLADPFATEVVAVPTRGIERWLTQRVSVEFAKRGVGDGVCANIAFPSPKRLVYDVLSAVPQLAVSLDASEGHSVVSHLLNALDVHRGQEWLWLLDRYIGESNGTQETGQRLNAARKIALLFASYARRRPEMIRRWAAGDDAGLDGTPIAEAAAWQPRLWRIVRDTIDVPLLPELLPGGLGPIRTGAVDLDLPPRLAVYGLTALDPMDLQVFEAVAEQRDVYLYLLHPSPALWRQISQIDVPPAVRRDDDPTESLAVHPLLVSWGRDSRELQVILQRIAHGAAGPAPREKGDDGLLGRLQADIRENTEPQLAAVVDEGIDDRSIQIHVCHGARRQVEVLRDAVLHVLAADSTIEPRDIVIMTPDLATFAPLLEAAFPEAPEDRSDDALPDLRVRIADRAPAATNPLVRFAATVLDLADGRIGAGTVKELIVDPVVRQRFAITEDTAASLLKLIDDLNVKWGLDAAHRAAWGAGALDDHTWRRGLDRALAGVYLSDSLVRVVDTIAPLDGIEGQDAASAGLLAQVVDRIVAARDLLAARMPLREWGDAIATAVRLLAAPAWQDEWQWTQLERLLAESFDPADGAVDDPVLSRAEARLLIAEWVQDRPSPLHFRTGDITVCTLVPMRSVPYRVVCLLGMDDERFPRLGSADGDDLLVDHEMIGDPERSAEDRQLLLDALMAAGDHLIVTYSGRDELTNAAYPPAVPVAELEDVLGVMVGSDGLKALVTVHPLQGFSRDNFITGRLGRDGPWSFDPMALDGARAVRDGPAPAEPGLGVTEPLDVPDPILLSDVITFLQHPAKWFLKNHLQLSIPGASEASDDTLPVDIGGLELWAIKEKLLVGLSNGEAIGAVANHIRASDALPPGDLGSDDLDSAIAEASELWEVAQKHGITPQRNRPFVGTLKVGTQVVEGRVMADPEAAHIGVVTPSRLGAKRRLGAFADLAFISALAPEQEWKAVLAGRAERGQKLKVITVGPIGKDPADRRHAATELLSGLMSLYVQGHAGPVPLPPKTAYAWQRGLGQNRGAAFQKANHEWANDRFSPEREDPANAMVFPHLSDIDALLKSDFVAYAERLWLSILPLCREQTP